VIPLNWMSLSPLLLFALPLWWRSARHEPRFWLPLAWVAFTILFFSATPAKRDIYLYPALPVAALALAPLFDQLVQRAAVKWVCFLLASLATLALIAVWRYDVFRSRIPPPHSRIHAVRLAGGSRSADRDRVPARARIPMALRHLAHYLAGLPSLCHTAAERSPILARPVEVAAHRTRPELGPLGASKPAAARLLRTEPALFDWNAR
jgi:hypothetical protein